jgi:hypothetical protein
MTTPAGRSSLRLSTDNDRGAGLDDEAAGDQLVSQISRQIRQIIDGQIFPAIVPHGLRHRLAYSSAASRSAVSVGRSIVTE